MRGTFKYHNNHQQLSKHSHTSTSLHSKQFSKRHLTQTQLFSYLVVPYGPHDWRVEGKWFRVLSFAGFASRQWDRLHPSILCWSEDSSVRNRQRCVWQCTENQEGRGREAQMQWTVLHSHQAWAYHRWAWWLQSSCFWSGESQHIACNEPIVMWLFKIIKQPTRSTHANCALQYCRRTKVILPVLTIEHVCPSVEQLHSLQKFRFCKILLSTSLSACCTITINTWSSKQQYHTPKSICWSSVLFSLQLMRCYV